MSKPDPTWREFNLRCMQMPDGFQEAELTQLLADLLHIYKDIPIERRRACLTWAQAMLDYAP